MNNEEKILEILTNLTNDVSTIQSQISTLDAKVSALDSKVDTLDAKVDTLDAKVSGMQSQLDNVESQVDENTQILKALEHRSEVNKAEHENMLLQFARLSGTVSSIKADVHQIQETNQSLLEMYGEHEACIRTLRRQIV